MGTREFLDELSQLRAEIGGIQLSMLESRDLVTRGMIAHARADCKISNPAEPTDSEIASVLTSSDTLSDHIDLQAMLTKMFNVLQMGESILVASRSSNDLWTSTQRIVGCRDLVVAVQALDMMDQYITGQQRVQQFIGPEMRLAISLL